MAADSEFSLLFRKYVDGTASHDERLAFLKLVDQKDLQAELAQLVDMELQSRNTAYSLEEDEQQEILSNIYKAAPIRDSTVKKLVPVWMRFRFSPGRTVRIAAAVGAIVFGIWFFSNRSEILGDNLDNKIVYANDVAPGRSGATITLANGKRIKLRDSKGGVVIGDDLKYSDSTLVISNAATDRDEGMEAMTASTTKGQTYEFKLPDGTKVWLNAASSLRIPANFSAAETRKIHLTGEAYFEVATSYTSLQGKRTKQSFVVESNGQEIQVLGTHFNVKSYEDEGNTKTTLLEGSVKLSSSQGSQVILRPGEQGLNNGKIKVEQADLQEALAWKNGSIVFRDKTLEGLMRELSRWYDVAVVYASDAPKNVTFSGAVSRSRSLSAVLERMQTTGSVKFKIEGRTVTVMK